MKNKYFNSIDTECSTDENFEVKGEKKWKEKESGNLSKFHKAAHELGYILFILNDS